VESAQKARGAVSAGDGGERSCSSGLRGGARVGGCQAGRPKTSASAATVFSAGGGNELVTRPPSLQGKEEKGDSDLRVVGVGAEKPIVAWVGGGVLGLGGGGEGVGWGVGVWRGLIPALTDSSARRSTQGGVWGVCVGLFFVRTIVPSPPPPALAEGSARFGSSSPPKGSVTVPS